jgi:hypothetical protein
MAGGIELGAGTRVMPYVVPDPVRFAEFVLTEALHERGITAAPRQMGEAVDFTAFAGSYTDRMALGRARVPSARRRGRGSPSR